MLWGKLLFFCLYVVFIIIGERKLKYLKWLVRSVKYKFESLGGGWG